MSTPDPTQLPAVHTETQQPMGGPADRIGEAIAAAVSAAIAPLVHQAQTLLADVEAKGIDVDAHIDLGSYGILPIHFHLGVPKQ
jgi:hypothetical protein